MEDHARLPASLVKSPGSFAQGFSMLGMYFDSKPKALAVVVFCAGFGLLFAFAGVRRLVRFPQEASKMDAIVSGALGVGLGAALIAAAIWFARP